MKNIYFVFRKNSNPTSYKFLKDSAEERGLSVKTIYSDRLDFSERIELGRDDAIYRISTDRKSILVEKFLASENATSFFRNSHLDCIKELDNVVECTLLHEKNNLPIVNTIFSLTNDRAKLDRYVEALNGFPIVVKSVGGQHGVGVIKIESRESLNSFADYLINQHDRFILREYIDYAEHARLIVLGDEVISSIEYKRVRGDFRSNVGKELAVAGKKFGREIEKVAVEAVAALGYEFGGVDILIDKEGEPHIAEVNFPCYFPRAQESTGTDISGAMIDYLINKSEAR